MGNVICAFSLEQTSNITELSPSVLREWDTEDFFKPSLGYEQRRSPYSRVYTFEDVVGLRTLKLLRKRVSAQHLKKAAVKLKQHSGRLWSELTLYTLNGEVHFRNPSSGNIEGAVSGQYGATIPLETVAEEVRIRANKLQQRNPDKIGTIERHRFVMGNAPVFGGTRIPVANVVSLASAGYSPEDIIGEFPDLTKQDVDLALSIKDQLTDAA
jgi:uncharacterized protein (DUF433 family)